MTASHSVSRESRLERLLQFLEHDPNNLVLISDAATTAYEDGRLEKSVELIDRFIAIEQLTPALLNLRGLISIQGKDYTAAIKAFEDLSTAGHDDAAVHFNLAWALAMTGEYQAALDLLDEESIAISEQGPSLKVRMLHHLGQLDDALQCGAEFAARFPDNQPLMTALATAALDAEQIDLAQSYAMAAGENGEALAVLGAIELAQPNGGQSLSLLGRAVSLRPDSPRAQLGYGLALLTRGEAAKAAQSIDRGAELFGKHLGSWIAAGWAHYAAGDVKAARARFEHALELDPNFAESHGAFAVMAVEANHLEDARHHTEIALRLDRNCLSGALAKSLLLERDGNPAAAQKIRGLAMSRPIGPNGQTILDALTGSVSRMTKRP